MSEGCLVGTRSPDEDDLVQTTMVAGGRNANKRALQISAKIPANAIVRRRLVA
jgi:hypothetical protein